MREPRQGRTILRLVALISILSIFVFLGQPFAQEPGMEPPMDPGMEPGMEPGMGMPGMGGGAAAGGLTWSQQEMPEELTKTYDAFLAETGTARAAIPENFLYDDQGEPRENTNDQWRQLQRIYAARAVGGPAAAGALAGKPGYGLATRIQNEIAVKSSEVADVQFLYEKGLDNFSFEIGYPQYEHSAITPGANVVPVSIGVIMKVKPNVAQRYPSLVYRKLKKYDFYGTDREIFHIHDYEGGIWNPKKIYLYSGAVSTWNSLWSGNAVRLTLYDASGDQIASATQSAGHTGGICAKLLYPDELNYAPMHETIIPPRDKSFEGGNLNLPYKKGWYYNFSFSIPIGELAALDRAEAVLVGSGGQEGSRGASKPAPLDTSGYEGEASRAAVQAGVDRATATARRGVASSGYSLGPPIYTGPVMY